MAFIAVPSIAGRPRTYGSVPQEGPWPRQGGAGEAAPGQAVGRRAQRDPRRSAVHARGQGQRGENCVPCVRAGLFGLCWKSA